MQIIYIWMPFPFPSYQPRYFIPAIAFLPIPLVLCLQRFLLIDAFLSSSDGLPPLAR
jgi:hypothetical protein